MIDHKTDIELISGIIGDKYHRPGCGAFAALGAGGMASRTFDGDKSTILGMMVDMAARALAQNTESKKQLRQGLKAFVRDLTAAAHREWHQANDPPEITLTLDGAEAEKLKEAMT